MILHQQHHDQEKGEGGEERFERRFYRLGKVPLTKKKRKTKTIEIYSCFDKGGPKRRKRVRDNAEM